MTERLDRITESYGILEKDQLPYEDVLVFLGNVLDYVALYISDEEECFFPSELLKIEYPLLMESDIPTGTFVSFIKEPGNSLEKIDGEFIICINQSTEVRWIVKFTSKVQANYHKVKHYFLYDFEDEDDEFQAVVIDNLTPFKILERFCQTLEKSSY